MFAYNIFSLTYKTLTRFADNDDEEDCVPSRKYDILRPMPENNPDESFIDREIILVYNAKVE